jgi:NADPH:quinone reductase-like Zn-dependent oxidoreductase
MRQVQFQKVGWPHEVAENVEVPNPTLSSPETVLVRVEAFPINPADLLLLQGVYPPDPAAPNLPGVEGVGVVEAVGDAVRELVPGDRVIPLGNGNWREVLALPEDLLVKVPPGISVETAAGLKVNAATAVLLLSDYGDPRPGDWIIQNAANSSVGRAVTEVARQRGLRAIGVVRRPEVAQELRSLGAGHVLVDGEDLAGRVAAIIGSGQIRLAIDAVGGDASGRLSACLGPAGTLVVYGAMSGRPMQLDPGRVVFNDLRLHGFWLTRFLRTAPRSDILALYDEVFDLAAGGAFTPKLAGRFHVSEIKAALTHAEQSMGRGKTLVFFGPQ